MGPEDSDPNKVVLVNVGKPWTGVEVSKVEEITPAKLSRHAHGVMRIVLVAGLILVGGLTVYAVASADHKMVQDAWALGQYIVLTTLGWSVGRRSPMQ